MQRGRGWRSAVVALAMAASGIGATTGARPAAAATTTALVQVNAPATPVSLTSPGNSHVVSFQGIIGQVLTLTVTGGTFTNNCDATLTVRNPSGITLGSPTCVGQSGTISPAALTANGLFSATIVATGASVGSLQFQITSTAAKLSITPNASALAVVVGAGATVNLGFTAPLGNYVAAYGRDDVDCLTNYRIVRPDGVDQFAATCANGFSGVLTDQSLVGVGGTHKLRVVNTAAVSRTVLVQAFTGVNATANTTLDGAATTFSFLPTQQARLSFPVTAGQSFHVQIDNVGPPSPAALACATLFQPDGTNWGTDCGAQSLSGSTAPTIPDTHADVSGTWSVVLDPPTFAIPKLSIRVVSAADPTALVVDGFVRTYTAVPERNPVLLPTHLTAGEKLTIVLQRPVITTLLCRVTVDCSTTIDLVDASGTPDPTFHVQFQNADLPITRSTVIPTTGTWSLAVRSAITQPVALAAYDSSDVVFDQTVSGLQSVLFAGAAPEQAVVVRFTGTAGHTYRFQNSYPNSTIATAFLTVTDPLGATLVSTTPSCPATTCAPGFTAPIDGMYAFRVVPVAGTALANFGFTVIDTTTVITPVTLGVASPVVTTHLDQAVAFTFNGVVGQKISTKALAFSYSGASASVKFLRPAGSQLGTTRTISATSSFLDPVRLDANGTWTVLVAPTGMPRSGSMQVKFANVPDVTGALVVGTTIRSFTLGTAGQIARFTFTRSAGQTFRVRFAGSTFSGAAVTIAPPLGTPAALCTLDAGALDCPLHTATLPGTYTVVVNPPGERTGSATIAVTTS